MPATTIPAPKIVQLLHQSLSMLLVYHSKWTKRFLNCSFQYLVKPYHSITTKCFPFQPNSSKNYLYFMSTLLILSFLLNSFSFDCCLWTKLFLDTQKISRLPLLCHFLRCCLNSIGHRCSIPSILVETLSSFWILHSLLRNISWSDFPQLSVFLFSFVMLTSSSKLLCVPLSVGSSESVSFLSSLLFKHRAPHQLHLFTSYWLSSNSATRFALSWLKFLTFKTTNCSLISSNYFSFQQKHF